MTPVTAVIPNWNGGARLERVLADLAAQSRRLDRVIVADNGSQDGSDVAAERAGAEVIRFGWNSGFSRAVNAGIEAARGEWIAILNNDVELAPDWLERLVDRCTGQFWFATGKTYSACARDRIDATFDLPSLARTAWRCGSGKLDAAVWNQPRAISCAPLTAAVFRRELFDLVGLLDERFESYLEDVDLAIRCALAGIEGVYVPDAHAWHHGSATLGEWHPETTRLIARNQVYLAAKYPPASRLSRAAWSIVVGQLLWGLVALRHGRGIAFLRGKREGLCTMARFGTPARSPSETDKILHLHQKRIFDLQSQAGWEPYWRLYRALT